MFDRRPDEGPGPSGLGAVSTEDLEHEVESIAARFAASTCHWLELVGELDHREAWANWGCLSCSHWLAWRCSLTQRAAREHVRVARAIRTLPAIRERFAAGELSFSKVRALTRIATPDSEAGLLEIAEVATAAQLEQIMRAHRRVTLADQNDAESACHVSAFWDNDGTLVINARLSALDGAMFLKGMDAAGESLAELWRAEHDEQAEAGRKGRGGSAEPPGGEQQAVPRPNRADALAAMAETAIEQRQRNRGIDGPRRQAVVVHVDAERLIGERDGRCHLEGGPAIAPETAQKVACDAAIDLVLEDAGRAVTIGRRSRAVPAPMRRALEARDQSRCAFPGCNRTRFLDAHHIQHWAHGGETSLDNLILLCRAHHRKLHEEGFALSRDRGSGAPTFTGPDGRRIDPAPRLCDHGSRGRSTRRLPPASRRLAPGTGERMNLHDVLFAVLRL